MIAVVVRATRCSADVKSGASLKFRHVPLLNVGELKEKKRKEEIKEKWRENKTRPREFRRGVGKRAGDISPTIFSISLFFSFGVIFRSFKISRITPYMVV